MKVFPWILWMEGVRVVFKRFGPRPTELSVFNCEKGSF
jgi:hypothetical protein